MQRRSLMFILMGALVPATAVGVALASPMSGVSGVPHVEGADLAANTKVNADGIKFQTKQPTDVSVLTLTVAPNGTTGWHSHPGFAVIAVTEGTGTLRFADCHSETIPAGRAFVETGDDAPTEFRNETSEPVVLTVTFFAPQGAPILEDETPPDCS